MAKTVKVTSAQVRAAKTVIRRAAEKGEPVSDAVRKVAEAKRKPKAQPPAEATASGTRVGSTAFYDRMTDVVVHESASHDGRPHVTFIESRKAFAQLNASLAHLTEDDSWLKVPVIDGLFLPTSLFAGHFQAGSVEELATHFDAVLEQAVEKIKLQRPKVQEVTPTSD